MGCSRTVTLNQGHARWRRFGRPLNWSETTIFTVDMIVTEFDASTARGQQAKASRTWGRLAKQLHFQSKHLTASTWEVDRQLDSRASQRRVVHQDMLQTAQAEVNVQDPTWWVGSEALDPSASLQAATVGQRFWHLL